jgi:lipopolysaccharide/colanic/teichoic acid biosynthesis glycosyltransferase
MDLGIAIVAIIVLSPLFVICAFLVKLTSPVQYFTAMPE